MTTKALECFIMVADTRSFAKASEILFMSPSTVSYQIKQLEEELGFSLFESDNRIEMTPAGRQVYEQATRLTQDWQKTVHTARLINAQHRRTLHIGMRRLMDEDALALLLDRFYHSQTEYGVMLHMYRQGYFVPDLLYGNRDLLFADSMEIARNDEIAFVPLCPSYTGYAISRQHPLAEKSCIRFEDIRDEKLILPAVPPGTDESPFAQMIKRYCSNANISYADCHENAILCASANIAISAISYCVPSATPQVVFVPAQGFENLHLCLAWCRSNHSPGVAMLVRLAQEIFPGIA